MIVIQIVYMIIGVLGFFGYLSNKKLSSLGLAGLFFLGGLLSMIFSGWWWFLAPLLDGLVIRPAVFFKKGKMPGDDSRKSIKK